MSLDRHTLDTNGRKGIPPFTEPNSGRSRFRFTPVVTTNGRAPALFSYWHNESLRRLNDRNQKAAISLPMPIARRGRFYLWIRKCLRSAEGMEFALISRGFRLVP